MCDADVKEINSNPHNLSLRECKTVIACAQLCTKMRMVQADFCECYLLDDNGVATGNPFYCLQEEFICTKTHGKFTKWIGNHTDPSLIVGRGKSPAQRTAAAFTHFTYDTFKGRLVFVDLQGSLDGHLWTDPQIHSLDVRFGKGDHGARGLVAWRDSHKCNALCIAMGLTTQLPDVPSSNADRDADTTADSDGEPAKNTRAKKRAKVVEVGADEEVVEVVTE
jgi:hypothetical protein